MSEKIYNEEDVRKFYQFFKHNNPTEIRVFDKDKYPMGHSEFVKTEDDFVKRCRYYCEEEKVSVYIGARDRDGRGDKNVKSSSFIFFEIDEHGENKTEERDKIIEFLKENNISIGMQGMSGGGWHFYIPHNLVKFKDSDMAFEYKEASLISFKKVMQNQGFDIDGAVFNLERVTRVLGTFNYKRDKISNIDFINENCEENKNTIALTELLKKYKINVNINDKRDNDFIVDDDDFITEVKKKWVAPGRENLALSVAGYLRKEKRLGLNSAISIVKRICQDCNDEEIESRLVAVRRTYDLDEKDIKGYSGLKENDIKVTSELSWDQIKRCIKNELGDGENYYKTDLKWKLIINNKDTITGKPQLIDSVKKNIVLGRETIKKGREEDSSGKIIDVEKRKIILFDEKFDKRYSGPIISVFSKKYFIYRVIEKDGEEYFILSESHLPNENCTFRGMKVDVDDFAEISKSMRIGCLTSVFFLSDYKSDVVILPPEDIVKFTSSRKISEDDWLEFLAYHRDLDSFNRFPKITELLKSAHILSSKVDGWPLHLGVIGPQGSRKSKGFIETIAYKMDDSPNIVEGANSRIKGLTPSFKEKPANLGYLANCNRMGWIDELGKMVEFEINKHQGGNRNVLGEANFLLEHSIRQVSSGNDNTVTVGATAKFVFVMNPLSYKRNIYDHVGSIDPTTMSRILWWVQDEEEQDFVTSDKGVVRNRYKSPPHIHNPPKHFSGKLSFIGKNDSKAWLSVGGKIQNIDEFLTIFDSCNNFKCGIDYDKLEELVNFSILMAKEPMKSVWKPRADHHIELLIDGICKHRCMFIDYDSSFIANDSDYEIVKAMLTRMVSGWDTDFTIKRGII